MTRIRSGVKRPIFCFLNMLKATTAAMMCTKSDENSAHRNTWYQISTKGQEDKQKVSRGSLGVSPMTLMTESRSDVSKSAPAAIWGTCSGSGLCYSEQGTRNQSKSATKAHNRLPFGTIFIQPEVPASMWRSGLSAYKSLNGCIDVVLCELSLWNRDFQVGRRVSPTVPSSSEVKMPHPQGSHRTEKDA
ncbi:unnamed protein product [Ixodes pacificus]